MSQHFTHLHLHTEFSLLDGAIQIEKLIDFGKNNILKRLPSLIMVIFLVR